jgi:hypothetical protein
MTTRTWFGGTGDWDTASDWSGDQAPGNADTADINAGTVDISSADAGIDVGSVSIASGATLAITDPGQTQTVAGGLSNSGTLEVDVSGSGGSSLVVDGLLTNSGATTQGLLIGNSGITSSTSVQVGSLSEMGSISLLGGSASATATLSVGGTSTDSSKVIMNAFGDLVVTGALTLQGAAIMGGELTTSGGGTIGNSGGNATLLTSVTISSGTTYVDGDNLELSGAIDVAGSIQVGSTGAATLTIAPSGATLSGGGAVNLFDSASTSISGGALVNAGVTIAGAGEISGLTSFDNQASGVVDANQTAVLNFYYQANATNEGLVEATSSGQLYIDGTTLTQSGAGQVEANGSKSLVELYAGTIVGGTLTTTNNGEIASVNGALTNVTISTGSTFTVLPGDSVTLSGTIVDQGQIMLGTTTVGSSIDITTGGATLTGGGAVVMSDISNNSISGNGAFVNVDDTIEGSGEISGLKSFDNQASGVVDADQTAVLNFYYQANATNEGLVEATSSGQLYIDGTTLAQSGAGQVEANGANSLVELYAGTIVGGTLTTTNGGEIASENGALTNVTITTGSTFTVLPNVSVTLSGTIVDQGQIDLGTPTTGSSIVLTSAGATLTGGGAVVMTDDANNTISGNGAFVNVDDTIEGSGQISSLESFDNQSGAMIDANQGVPLTLYDQAAATNEGTVEATSGGTFVLDFSTLTQNQSGANGTLLASGTGSKVELSSATLIGGTLTTTGGGIIESSGGNGATLQGVIISSGSIVTDPYGSALYLSGTIVNQGEIAVGSSTNGSSLFVGASGATLTGGGVIALGNNSGNLFDANGAAGELVNVDDSIQGSGSVTGLASLANDAGATVDADQSTPLLIYSISGGVTNNGVFEATGGGTLHVEESVAGSGVFSVQANSEVDLGGATSETTDFAGADATLKLDTPTNYTGTISGLAIGDVLDLGDTTAILATPSANGLNTTLTVTVSGAPALTYTLAGDYVGDSFTVTQSGSDSLVRLTATTPPPTLGGAANTVDYTQNGSAVPVDSGLTLTDASDPIATGAAVQITSGLLPGDQLNFSNQNGISGVYNPTSGLLTLSGVALLGAYQTALDSVTYNSASSNPTNSAADPTRTVSWSTSNGPGNSTPVTSTIDVLALPQVTAGGSATYTQGPPAAVADSGLTVTDFSSANLKGATIDISTGFQSGDTLAASSLDGGAISETYASGVLTLTGSASLAAYQAALDSVAFSSTSLDPTEYGTDLSRSLSWQVTDSNGSISPTATSGLTVVGVDQPPALGGGGNTTIYTIGGSAQVVDGGLTASDPDSLDLASATVTITGDLASGDTLAATNLDGGAITETYADGVLTLSGSASVTSYQAALDSVTLSTSSVSEAARTVSWQVNDGTLNSNAVASTIDIAAQPPVLSGAGNTVSYTQGPAETAVDTALTVADPGSATLTGATVDIAAGLQSGDTLAASNLDAGAISESYASGVLTLTGSASLAAYQAALDSVAFSSTSLNPTDYGTDPGRSVSWQVTDSNGLTSAAVTSDVTVVGVDQPPVLASAGNTATYTIGGSAQTVDNGLSVSDPDSLDLASATVSITGGLTNGDTLAASNLDNGALTETYANGVLMLSGAATVAAYRVALDSVTFSTTSASQSARTVGWQVNDGTLNSNAVASTIDIAVLPPVLSGAGNTVSYTQDGAATPVDGALAVTDRSSANLTGATVDIGPGLQSGDTLTASNLDNGAISESYASGFLTLTGTASLAAYQTALDTVAFTSTSLNPTDYGTDLSRSVSWQVTDSNGLTSAAVTSNVTVVGVDQPPVLASAGNTVTYTVDGSAQIVDSGLTASDPDSLDLASATVSITGGLASGDTLAASNLDGGAITETYANGVLTLTGSASVAAYQAVLDSVTFSTSSTSPSARTVSWKVNDGTLNSNTVTSSIDIAVQSPELSGAGNTVSYSQGSAAVAVDGALTVADPSSATLTGATVDISAGLQNGDTLAASNLDGGAISESYASGVLTLTGSASLAAYQAALDSVAFRSTSANLAARTVTWTVSSGVETSAPVASNVDIVASGPPVLGDGSNTITFVPFLPNSVSSALPVAKPVAVDSALTVSDAGSATLTSAKVAISAGLLGGDELPFTAQSGIAGSYNATTGVLTLTGTASLAAYQAALDSVTYTSLNDNPSNDGADNTRTITWTASSGAFTSAPITSTIDIDQSDYYLTTETDIINGQGNDTIVASSAATLNPTDVINGGSGTNTLLLQGQGYFNLGLPNTLTNIQTVDVSEGGVRGFFGLSANSTLALRNGMNNVTVNVSSSSGTAGGAIDIVGANNNDVINLGAGNDQVAVGSANETVDGGSGEYTIAVSNSTIGATINGGSNANTQLDVETTGGSLVMGANIKNVPNVYIFSTNFAPYTFTANATPGLTVSDYSFGNHDTLIAGGPSQTLFATGQNDTLIGAAQGGTDFKLSDYGFFGSTSRIENFGALNDVMDLEDLSRANSTISYEQTGAGSGTLTVTGREFGFRVTETFTLTGQFNPSEFHTSAAPDGSLDITYGEQSVKSVKPDGSYDIAYSNVTGASYSSYEDIFNSAGTLLAAAFDNTNGTGNAILYGGGLTIGSSSTAETATTGADVFTLPHHANETISATGSSSDTFVFTPTFGADAIAGFVAGGAGHDVVQFETSAFSYLTPGMTQAQDLAAVLGHAPQTAAGNTIITDSHGDAVTLDAIAKATLAANAADFKFV